MASITKTAAGTWKAMIRKKGQPAVSKSFRTKRDAEDWARGIEDEMVRGMYIKRSEAERMTLEGAVGKYLAEVTPTKKLASQKSDNQRARTLIEYLGKFSAIHARNFLRENNQKRRLSGPSCALRFSVRQAMPPEIKAG